MAIINGFDHITQDADDSCLSRVVRSMLRFKTVQYELGSFRSSDCFLSSGG